MCHVEDQWEVIEGSLYVAEPKYAHHDVVVTKMSAPLAKQQLLVVVIAEFVDDAAHLFRAEEQMLLDVDHGPCFSHGSNQISLSGQKGRKLNNAGNLGGCLLQTVHIGNHRNAVGVFHCLEDFKLFVEAGFTEGVNGGAVRFVVRGLEDERDGQLFASILEVLRAPQGKVQIL